MRTSERYNLGTAGPRRRGRGGMSSAYAVLALTVMVGLCSLGVDFGRVQLVKTELQRAADAASRAAASAAPGGIAAAQSAAVTWAANNTADGSSVVVDSTNDVDFGTWNSTTKTFTVLTGAARANANAIRVWARRVASRGTAVPLIWASALGRSGGCDVQASSTSLVTLQTDYGAVGLTSLTLHTNTITTDSYDASAGAYAAASATNYGYLASNGTITLNGTISVKKNLYMQSASTLSTGGTVTYGSRINLSSSLAFPTPAAGSYATTNDNPSVGLPSSGGPAYISSGTTTVAGGNYYLTSFSISGGTLTFTGPATLWVNGNVSITGGTINTYQNLPANLAIKVCAASTTVGISGVTPLYADVQAPASTLTLGAGNYYGRWVGKTLNVTGSTNLHFDLSLAPYSGGSTIPGTLAPQHISYVK